MPRTPATDRPRPFLIRPVPANGRVMGKHRRLWAVKQGPRWRFVRCVCIQVTIASVVDEREGICLAGVGVVHRLKHSEILITA